MIVTMKCLNEERSVDRVLAGFHDEKWVDRIIVIDGGSTDYTVHELAKWKKCEVYLHPWLNDYHDMEITQSNIALSYVPHGQLCFILDFDERLSPRLKAVLAHLDKKGLPEDSDVGHVSRATFELIRHEDSPHAVIGDDGWPLLSHQIGQFPDYQCRLVARSPYHHWINSPHHQLAGWQKNVRLGQDAYLVHYEKDDLRDRERIEKKWARCQARRKELGLTCDLFETRVQPQLQKFTDPRTWA